MASCLECLRWTLNQQFYQVTAEKTLRAHRPSLVWQYESCCRSFQDVLHLGDIPQVTGDSPGFPVMASHLHQQGTSHHLSTLCSTSGPSPVQPGYTGHRQGPFPTEEGDMHCMGPREIANCGLVSAVPDLRGGHHRG